MRGRIRMELRRNGELVDVREATNAVMQSGGTLVAQLFAGVAHTGITHLGVGSSDTPETDQYATAALTPGDLTGGTEAPIPPEAIVIEPPSATSRTVKVRIRATLPASAAVGTVREAGLISRAPAPVPLPVVTAAPVSAAAHVSAAAPVSAPSPAPAVPIPPVPTPPVPIPIPIPIPLAPPPVLYNRVTFAPIVKGNDHELTMFWEVTFPYGDLQELI
jgi:hypothetical protein